MFRGTRSDLAARGLQQDGEVKQEHHPHDDRAIKAWTIRGPLGFDAGDANLYRYGRNDPTNKSDPSGMLPSSTLAVLAATLVFDGAAEQSARHPLGRLPVL